MYLELEVYWAEDEWEKKEDLGMDIETDLGVIFLNTNNISAHHANDNGETMIRMNNGECFRSPVAHESFIDLMNEITLKVEIKVSNN